MADPILGGVQIGDSFKVILFQMLYGQRVMNVLHYVCSDDGGMPSPDRFQVCKALATELTGAVSLLTDLKTVQSEDLSHTSIRVQLLKEVDATYPFWEENTGGTGAVAGPAGTANISASIEKRASFDTGHPRQGIGRVAVAGIPQSGYEAGVLKPAYMADYNGLVEDMTDEVTVLTVVKLAPCLSRKGATVWLDNVIFAASLHPEVRDMTRRTVGRGI